MNTNSIEASSVGPCARAYASTSWLYLAFLGFAAGTAAVAWLVASLYKTYVGTLPVDASILLPVFRSLLDPEPVERFTFLSLASTLPALSFIFALKAEGNQIRSSSLVLSATIAAVVAAVFFVPFAQFGFDPSLLAEKHLTLKHTFLLLGCTATAVVLMYVVPGRRSLHAKHRFMSYIAWSIFIASAVLQVIAWRIVNADSITEATWWESMDAVMYPVSQVVGGHTLLADLPSQYGLFPEFIAPFFRFVDLSLFSFSALFAVMQMISLASVYWVAQKKLRHPLFRIGFGVALVMITYETCLVLIGVRDQYFQYWPIRFFWPALSVLAFSLYAQKPTLRRAVLMSSVGAIASLWNADSGLIVEAAFGAFLFAKWTALFSRDKSRSGTERRLIVRKLCLHIAIFVLVIVAAALYLLLKADRPMHWAWLTEYQRLFYGLGFMMLPLPLRASPWIAILGVYLLGILVASSTWRQSPRSRFADMLLYVSLLGVGLFVYYEGRSHILNLVTVSWPALLAASLMADRLTRATTVGILHRAFMAPAAVAGGVILVCCVAFFRGVPMLVDSVVATIARWSAPMSQVVHDEIEFISSNAKRGEKCVILSKRQGLYYASLHLISPLVGPGYTETLTIRDRDSMIAQLREHKFNCVFVGERGSAPQLGIDLLGALQSYRVVRLNSLKTMAQLAPN